MGSMMEFAPSVDLAEFENHVGLERIEAPQDIRRPKPVAGADPIPRLAASTSLRLGRIQATEDAITSLPLIALDLASALVASIAAMWLGTWIGTPLHPAFPYGVVFMTLFFQYIHGLYPGVGVQYPAEFRGVFRTSLFVSLGTGFAMVARTDLVPFQILSWLTVSTLLFLGLASLRPIARHRLKKYDWWTQPVAVLGSGERAMRLMRRIDGLGHEGFRAAGMISDIGQTWTSGSSAATFHARTPLRWLGPQCELESILDDESICRVAVADRETVGWRDFHCFHGIPHVMLPGDLGQQPIERMRIRENSGEVEICCDTSLVKPLALVIKRAADLLLICATAPFWLAVMGMVAVAMKCCDPGPIFYRQRRVGRYGKQFEAIKFRSMVVNADKKLKDYLATRPDIRAEWQATHKLRNDPRITKIGAFLRKSSLDEL
ncbi:MAG: sugar transferase, partial [Marinobacter sp.]|uniref:sugar transferase n=1 Tax=Marinobacter sp. TaxID=50741 RepID=UPI003266BD44